MKHRIQKALTLLVATALSLASATSARATVSTTSQTAPCRVAGPQRQRRAVQLNDRPPGEGPRPSIRVTRWWQGSQCRPVRVLSAAYRRPRTPTSEWSRRGRPCVAGMCAAQSPRMSLPRPRLRGGRPSGPSGAPFGPLPPLPCARRRTLGRTCRGVQEWAIPSVVSSQGPFIIFLLHDHCASSSTARRKLSATKSAIATPTASPTSHELRK